MNNLCLLDLDHTLIYGSYANSEKVELLYQYNEYLKVYKRPYVDDFVRYLNLKFNTIIVYTTAKDDYAQRICFELGINFKSILSRKDCLYKNERHYKLFKSKWYKNFCEIQIIDDSPNVWLNVSDFETNIKYIVPKEFRGEVDDKELLKIIELI